MAIHSLKKIAPIDFVSLLDTATKEEEQTNWVIQPLPQMLVARVIMTMSSTNQFTVSIIEEVISAGLVGWKNFIDENNKEVKFHRNNFKKIPGEILTELVSKIITISVIDEEEKKT